MKREPRLQFSDADLAEPKLEKPIKYIQESATKMALMSMNMKHAN